MAAKTGYPHNRSGYQANQPGRLEPSWQALCVVPVSHTLVAPQTVQRQPPSVLLNTRIPWPYLLS